MQSTANRLFFLIYLKLVIWMEPNLENMLTLCQPILHDGVCIYLGHAYDWRTILQSIDLRTKETSIYYPLQSTCETSLISRSTGYNNVGSGSLWRFSVDWKYSLYRIWVSDYSACFDVEFMKIIKITPNLRTFKDPICRGNMIDVSLLPFEDRKLDFNIKKFCLGAMYCQTFLGWVSTFVMYIELLAFSPFKTNVTSWQYTSEKDMNPCSFTFCEIFVSVR